MRQSDMSEICYLVGRTGKEHYRGLPGVKTDGMLANGCNMNVGGLIA